MPKLRGQTCGDEERAEYVSHVDNHADCGRGTMRAARARRRGPGGAEAR
jgi:hypothetical protein